VAQNDEQTTSAAPAKAAPRKTMAPAATDPAGADVDRAVRSRVAGSDLGDLSDRELDELTALLSAERARRGRTPVEPSFGLSEGERDELERTGRTVSPFTGEKRGDWPDDRTRPEQ
jgi:hypothetical protein